MSINDAAKNDSAKDALKLLRNEIDQIDLNIIDLLRKRAEIIEEVRHVKGKQAIYIRPGREANMLRVLSELPQGHIPKGLVHRLWREMISAFTLQEGAMQAAIYVPTHDGKFWDLARDHFGSFMPMQSFASADEAMQSMMIQNHQLAALPFPVKDDDLWWPELLKNDYASFSIFYAFPFDGIHGVGAPTTNDRGFVMGALAPEETGRDRTVTIIEWEKHVSQSEADQWLGCWAQYSVHNHIFSHKIGASPHSWIEWEGFFLNYEEAFQTWCKQSEGIKKARIIGAYPVPMMRE